jgi:hypothetical protein
MTKPKRAFAEMLVAARGGSGDVDDICENMNLMDIIYELKRLEKEEPEPEPPTPAPSPEPEPEPVPVAVPEPPPQRVFRPNFWSRLANEDGED